VEEKEDEKIIMKWGLQSVSIRMGKSAEGGGGGVGGGGGGGVFHNLIANEEAQSTE
jgi:hypothetical protein